MIANLLKDRLAKLVAVYSVWVGAGIFSASLIYLYFMDAGVTQSDLVASFFFSTSAAVLAVLLLNNRTYDLRKPIVFGMSIMALVYLVLYLLPPTKYLLFLFSAAVGANFFLFWGPFNMMYFEKSHEKAAFFSSIYFSMGSAMSLVLPLAAAFVADNYGFRTVFLIAAIVYLAMTSAVPYLQKTEYHHSVRRCIGETKGFKTLLLVDGIYGGGTMAALAVIPLMYFTDPVDLGVFISITTIFSILASFLVSTLSDKGKRRKFYIRIFGVCVGLATMASSLAVTAGTWYTAVSIRNFFATLFYPFTTAIIMDSRKNIADFMVGRELLLNLGRIIGVAIVFACTLLFSNIHLSLVFLGLVILLYPVVIELKRKHLSVI